VERHFISLASSRFGSKVDHPSVFPDEMTIDLKNPSRGWVEGLAHIVGGI